MAEMNDPDVRVRTLESALVESEARLTESEARRAKSEAKLVAVEVQREKLRTAYDELLRELALIKRRMFIAKAERVDTSQLQLDFGAILKQLDAIAGTQRPGDSGENGDNPDGDNPDGDNPDGDNPDGRKPPRRSKPKGRRNLADADLPEERIEIVDPLFEELVEQGKASRIGFDVSCQLGWQTGGPRRVAIAKVKYRIVDESGEAHAATTFAPVALLPRSLAAPSMLAHVLVSKYNDGLPFNRLEEILARDGLRLDRGTMCRWAEELGSTLGAAIVEAMKRDAFETAFCIAADATGIAVQPERPPDRGGKRKRQPCHRGHYMVMIADRDHIWFEYTRRETSAAVAEMFRGYSGYVQVDAKSVFDVLFRGGGEAKPPGRVEVGCWAHMRRKFWEASLAHCELAREALARISRIFELDAGWRARPVEEITRLRQTHLKVHVDALLEWAEVEHEVVKNIRGPLRTALGYCTRQKGALTSFLEDGRLRMDNNPSELALRGRVAVGRKAWLFVGSDKHAESASGLMSLIASARLHKLNPQAYLRDIIRVLPHWPLDRNLELAPKYWASTRARLDPDELKLEVGPLTVPEPLPAAPEEQSTPD